MYKGDIKIQKVAKSTIICQKIAELEKETFKENSWSEKLISSELDNPNSEVWVLIDSHDILGYLIIRKIFDEAEILRIGIRPVFQGKGLGKKLLGEVIKILEREGIRRMFLEVNKENKIAYNLYKKFGFEEVYIRKGYYVNEDAVVMSKSLPA